MVGRDHGADLGAVVQWVADFHLLGQHLDHAEEVVGDRLVHDQPAAGIAAFASVEEATEHRGIRRGFEVGVREHDLTVLAAEFHRDFLQRIGRSGHGHLADVGRAGEGHHLDQRVADHRRTDIGAEAGEDVDDAGR